MTRFLPAFAFFIIGFAFSGKSQVTAGFTFDPPAAAAFCNPIPVYFHSTTTSTGGSFSLSWNFGTTPGIQSNLTHPSFYYYGSGTYDITLIATHSATGVSDTAVHSITIHNTPFPAFGMDDTTVCANTLVYFKDFSFLNTNVATYQWNFDDPASGANNTSSLQNPTHAYTQPGMYNVTMLIITVQGCSATVSNQVFIDPAPTVTASNDTAICSNASAALTANGALTYNWEPAQTLSDANSATPVASPTATTTYTVTAYDAGGCFVTEEVIVTIVTNGYADAGPDQTICAGTDASLQASGLTSYNWNPASGLDYSNISNPTASPLASTVYVVSGVDQNGCVASDSVLVYVLPVPVADAGLDHTVCFGESTFLQGAGGSAFAWSPSNELFNANSFLAFCNPTITTTFTLTVSNGNGCSETDEVVVTVHQNPELTVANSVVICPGGVATLAASGAAWYQWSPAAGLSQTDVADPQAYAGIEASYVVTGTGAFGCTDTAQVNLRIKIPDDIKVQPGATICAGEQVQLSASGMIAYEWMPNNGLDNPFVPEPFCLPPYSITYKVKGFDGCYYDSAFVEVKINDAEPVDAGSDLQTFANNPVQLQAAGLGSFTWFPAEGLSCVACSDPMATVANTTTYVVSNYNPDGCRTDDTVVVHVSCAESLVFVPNAFTPNGDGKNERFYVRTKGLKNLDFFRVFTRTGELVFETTNADEGWDGTFKGCALPPGVFSYNVLATCAEDGKIEFNGNVTLIR